MNTTDKDIIYFNDLLIKDSRSQDCALEIYKSMEYIAEEIRKSLNGTIIHSFEEKETFITHEICLYMIDFFINKRPFPPGTIDVITENINLIEQYDKRPIEKTEDIFSFMSKFKYRALLAVSKMIGIEKEKE
jgi:hypothetical protein